MAGERDIQRALDTLRKGRGSIGRRHSHHHGNTDDDNNHRRRALEGLCGDCKNLIVWLKEAQLRDKVILRCLAGCSPHLLYRGTRLGNQAKCDEFVPTAQLSSVS